MKRCVLVLCALLAALLPASAALGAAEEPFVVTGHAPKGEAPNPTEVSLTFSAPVVSADAVGEPWPYGKAPFKVIPEVPGRHSWTDTRTCVFRSIPGVYMPATSYAAVADPELRDRRGRLLAGRHRFPFHTPRLTFRGVRQREFAPGGDLALDLEFSLPVERRRLRGYLEITDEKDRGVRYRVGSGPPTRRVPVVVDGFSGTELRLEIARGMPPALGELGLEETVARTVSPSFELEIERAYASSTGPEEGRIVVKTTTPVDLERAAGFVQLQPGTPFNVAPFHGGFAITGPFRPRDRVVVSISAGLPGQGEATLEQAYRRAFVFPDLSPSVTFPVPGGHLSSRGSMRLPIETTNVDEIEVQAWRVYDGNVPVVAGLGERYLARSLSRMAARETFVPGGMPNERTRRALDLKQFVSPDRGLFLFSAWEKTDGWGPSDRLLVNVSDLGVVAKRSPRGLVAWVNSLAGAEPVEGATVRVYSGSNVELGAGTTGDGGICRIDAPGGWGEQLEPQLVTVAAGGDLTYLTFDNERVGAAGYERTGRPYLREGYEAYLFTPRGIFRPGADVPLTGLVRAAGGGVPERFPVRFEVRSPGGRTIFTETATLSAQGFGHCAFPLPDTALTGQYEARLTLPGEGSLLGTASFQVEDFAPPRLKVATELSPDMMVPGEEGTAAVEARYLFDAPAAGLPVEGSISLVERPFRPGGWEQYRFGDSEADVRPFENYLGRKRLDDAGKSVFRFQAPDPGGRTLPGLLRFRSSVMEEGGRWDHDTADLRYQPYPVVLGLALPSGDPTAGTELELGIAAVKPAGDPLIAGRVQVAVSRIQWRTVVTRDDDGYSHRTEEELIPVVRREVSISEGEGALRFTPSRPGRYVVAVDDEATGCRARRTFSVYGDWAGSGGAGTELARVRCSVTPGEVRPGEEVAVHYTLPFAGQVLATVETDGVLLTETFEAEELSGTFSFTAEESMMPNGYVTLWVVQPVESGDPQWKPFRGMGVASLRVTDPGDDLQVRLEAPEETRPDRSLDVAVTLRDARGDPVTGEVALALVDEGILSLTSFATPDPAAFFAASRRLGVDTFDLYGDLIAGEGSDTTLLHPAGGEGGMGMEPSALSPVKARTFKPLALYRAPVATDDQGRARFTLPLPEWNGTARLMAVAAAGERSGAAESDVLIARKIVLESTLPRVAAPGDTFRVPVTIFNKSDADAAVSVAMRLDGPLEATAKASPVFTQYVPAGQAADAINLPLKAADESGRGTLSLRLSWDDQVVEQTKELPVRPGFPAVTEYGYGSVQGGGTATVTFPRGWMRGTAEGELFLSGAPRASLGTALAFLRSYPYGCLEQTVSGAWPFIALPELVRETDPLLVDRTELEGRLQRAVRRVLGLQYYDGSFRAWASGYPASDWSSVYACHFLAAARDAGSDVPDGPYQSAMGFLRRTLAAPPTSGSDAQRRDQRAVKAYACYVLALDGNAPLAWMDALSRETDGMSAPGPSLLAGAYALSGQRKEARRILQGAGGVAPTETGGRLLDSVLRNRSARLLGWVRTAPESAETVRLAQSLLAPREQSRYMTTQESAFRVLALGRYLAGTRAQRGPFRAEVRSDVGTLLGSATPDEELRLALDGSAGPMKISCAGEGRVYYSWTLRGVPTVPPEPMQQGLRLERIVTDREGHPVRLDKPIPRGTLLYLRLELTPQRKARDIVVSELLPGGLEIENATVDDDLQSAGSGLRVEPRDDRLLLFIDSVPQGETFRHTYSVRAVTEGSFMLPPTAAEGMYDPSLRTIGAPGELTIH